MSVLKIISALAGAFVLAISGQAAAQQLSNGQVKSLSKFTSINVMDGGSVTIRPSSTYAITAIEGAEKVSYSIRGGELKIRCKKPCRNTTKRVVEVSIPKISKITVGSGGRVTVANGFREQASLQLKASRGGRIDAYSLRAKNANATVTGGGSIKVTATDTLEAAVIGAGDIIYDGNPEITYGKIAGGNIKARN